MTSLTTATVEFPLLLVNMKTYRESLGKRAVSLASMAGKIAEKTQICVAVAPQAVDLRLVVREVDIPVYSQHIDPVGYGKFTGHVLPEGVADAGCVGTLINHSERRLPLTVIEATVKKAGGLGLNSVVCVDTSEQARRVTLFNPDAIAVEPPELIGTGIPVSKARPEIVSNSVKAVKRRNPNVKVLCGAGITDGDDAAASLKLGAEGVLVASSIVKSDKPYEKLLELAEAMRRFTQSS